MSEIRIPDEVREAAGRVLASRAMDDSSYEEDAEAAVQAALSAWGATEEGRLVDNTRHKGEDPLSAVERALSRAERRIVTRWEADHAE